MDIKTIIFIAVASIYLVVSFVCVIIGLDLKKKLSWLYIVYGFISGLIAGLLITDVGTSLLLGILLAFIIMYGGATTHWNRERYKNKG